ncbi:MAG TPA: CDC27 family protein [Gemmatimonadales bacterium]|nr:CDC27 family protein [Gemmatimonadales bacterium]
MNPASLAVQPLANATGDSEKDYLADGLTEYLHGALTGVAALHVASRGATAALFGHSSLADQGRMLDARALLDGSVSTLGGVIRVQARLVQAADGVEYWTELLDRRPAQLLQGLHAIVARVLETLGAAPTAREQAALDHVPTTNDRAVDPYLRARHVSSQIRRTSQDFAIEMYGDAIQADAEFALAHAGIADAHSMLFAYWVSTDAHLQAADHASARAVQLAPELAETQLARGVALSLNKRHDEAEAAFRLALELKGNDFDAHYQFARHCRTVGRLVEAARWFESAARLRPEDYATPALLSSVYVSLAQPEQARDAQRRAVELADQRLKREPDDERALYLGASCLSSLGDTSRAREWAKRAVAMEPDDSAVLYNVACVYALLGLHDSAIDCLERAIQNGFGHWDWIAHDSDLDPLRAHPRFATLQTIKA